MLKNNNGKAILRLYRRMLKQNKLRNRVALLAIILTTLMFTAIFTMGFSTAKNINLMQLRTQGSKAFLYLEHPTDEQINAVKNAPYVHAAGIRIHAGEATDVKQEYSYGLEYYDQTEFTQNLTPAVKELCGSYPQKEDELMLSTTILQAIGIKEPKLGEKITFLVEGAEQTFVLSGYFTGFCPDHPILISEAFTRKRSLTAENAGKLCISAKEGKQEELILALRDRVKLSEEQKWDADYDVQSENGSNRVTIIGGMCLLALLIVVSGYLLIYNVMYISVARDIRFYGMLKTIGTAPSQIRSLVKKQTVHLAFIGIPIGVALGTALSFGVVPLVTQMFTGAATGALSADVDFHIGIYIFSVAFAAATVWLSVRKPARLAGMVSPVEALRYQAGQKAGVRAPKKITHHKRGKLFSMAFRNVFREKKRCFLVFASLFLGTMTFLCINCFIQCLDIDSYMEQYFANDYAIYARGEPEEETGQEGAADASLDVLAKKLEALDGMKYVRVNRNAHAVLPFSEELYRPFLKEQAENDEAFYKEMVSFYQNSEETGVPYGARVISMDRRQIEVYNRKAAQPIDPERFERGEVCIIGYLSSEDAANEMLGKKITIENGSTKAQGTIEIGSVAGMGKSGFLNIYGIYYQMGAPGDLIVSDAFFEKLFPEAEAFGIVADAKAGKDAIIAPKVQSLVKESPAVKECTIRSVEGRETRKAMFSLTVVGDLISGLLVLIGAINFINVMLTGVYTRKKEFAVLESIGMTKKQIKKMLVSEGAIYGIITVALVLTIGSVMVYGAGSVSRAVADYAIFRFPYALVAAVSAGILVICLLVPALVFREISKNTVTERLREGTV